MPAVYPSQSKAVASSALNTRAMRGKAPNRRIHTDARKSGARG